MQKKYLTTPLNGRGSTRVATKKILSERGLTSMNFRHGSSDIFIRDCPGGALSSCEFMKTIEWI